MAIRLSEEAAARLGLGRIVYNGAGKKRVLPKNTKRPDAVPRIEEASERADLVHVGAGVWRIEIEKERK